MQQNKSARKRSDYLLFAGSVIAIGGYCFCLDLPQTFQHLLQLQPYSITPLQFNVNYICMAYPIILASPFLGAFIDSKGTPLSLKVSSIGYFISQALLLLTFWWGYFENWYLVFLISRLGIGFFGGFLYQTVQVLIMKLCSQELKSQFVGLISSMPWIFYSFNSLISPLILTYFGTIRACIFFGVFISLIGLCSAGVILKYSELHCLRFKIGKKEIQSEKKESGFKFSKTFWLLCVIFAMTYINYTPFYDNGNDFFIARCNMSFAQAGAIIFLPTLIAVISSPIFGKIIQKFKRLRRFLLLTNFCYPVIFFLLLFLPSQPTTFAFLLSYFCMICLGLTIGTLVMVVSNTITKIVPEDMEGRAFGILNTFSMLGIGTIPIPMGLLINSGQNLSDGYFRCNIALVCLGGVSLIVSCLFQFLTQKQTICLDRLITLKQLEAQSVQEMH